MGKINENVIKRETWIDWSKAVLIWLMVLGHAAQVFRRSGGKWLQYIPIKCPLDIYIWHRLLYAVLVGVLGFNFHKMDAVVIFSLLTIVSFVMRKHMRLN